MNSKSVVWIGLLASMLLIFLCIYSNAESYYKELKWGDSNKKLIASVVTEKKEQEALNITNLNIEKEEDFDKQPVKDVSLNEEEKDIVKEEKIINKETSTFFYHTENQQKIISGALPLLEEGDEFKKFIAECVDTNSCDNSVTFLDNGETLSWKNLVLSTIGLFDKVGVENAKISVENQGIKLEGVFESQEAKSHLSSILIEHKLAYKIYDMTTIAVKEKPRFTIIKDDIKKDNKIEKDNDKQEDEIQKAQEEISKLLKNKQIHFLRGSGKITSEGKKVLDELVTALKDPNDVLLEIQGHTDAGGKEKNNLILSQVRASAVKKYLIKKGLKAENITAKGFGESKLLLPQKPYDISNRRVEIYLKRR